MLIYHPAYDAYHGIVRIVKILQVISSGKRLEVDRLRIYDYFFLFPNELENVTLPIMQSKFKRILKNNKYNKIQNAKSAFLQIEPIQVLSLKSLASFNFIDSTQLLSDFVQRTTQAIPEELILELSETEKEYLELVSTYFETITLKELKKRSGLMEYRYELS
jgi:uncharacterized protein YcbK (DUF882 family)